ncbi:hypothetical protein [Deinococcus koreensis]|uniref:Uncharacterized protein n=1 Tax=Deinococcus koreensis TaxID=2054903 RepID=A0A2K3USL3_9DEIO|nr:hypothetical protein [Deinococcus koreensis]PNY79508.1 hypothetical protein CVO96_18935 [Deinococcus koreensis]
MSDILSSLQQLRQTREEPQVEPAPAPVASTPSAASTATPTPEAQAGRGEDKTLAGRVPLALHRDLTRSLIDVADDLGWRRVNVDEALEAAIRVVLREPGAHERWVQELQQVRRERSG